MQQEWEEKKRQKQQQEILAYTWNKQKYNSKKVSITS